VYIPWFVDMKTVTMHDATAACCNLYDNMHARVTYLSDYTNMYVKNK